MNKYLIIAIVILLIYIYSYFIFPLSIVIIQTTLSDFNFNLLTEKQPIILGDKITDVNTIITSWFKFNIIQDILFNFKYNWNINYHKYLMIYCLEDTEILLYKAGYSVKNNVPDNKEIIVAVKVKENHCIIIPYKWYYNIKNNNNIKLYGIHDYITYILNIVT